MDLLQEQVAHGHCGQVGRLAGVRDLVLGAAGDFLVAADQNGRGNQTDNRGESVHLLYFELHDRGDGHALGVGLGAADGVSGGALVELHLLVGLDSHDAFDDGPADECLVDDGLVGLVDFWG